MSSIEQTPIYELSINGCVYWQAHSLSNAGSNGSNRLLPRRQLLGNGKETDACSGNIFKHYHSVLLAEYLEEVGEILCPACTLRDGRRAAALVGLDGYGELNMERVLECGVCDAHGFLITARRGDTTDNNQTRQRLSKSTLIDFSLALALPDSWGETVHLLTRSGDGREDGQMLMKKSARSGAYAFNIRYKSAGIGVDTHRWRIVLANEQQRLVRHKAILATLRDQILSPSGASTAIMLPHLTGLTGAIVIRTSVGRAPMYSALAPDFEDQLKALSGTTNWVIAFNSIAEFSAEMNSLIDSSYPHLPPNH